ncbi:anti-anti-sigma factor [Catalinimonas alkaloidigena]|uniref:Anti-sigma factor antagonist n=1 Tax=Catalinimonas alkaloidigena TaxID=1075417 RepID=A0A1G8ZS32_9BACT|nr:STAS domain-containing protein [Catalinimonas alkaloidigena]SDK17843.1 anti-anti-sigma factor [Catalinimonas alkaloidigena]
MKFTTDKEEKYCILRLEEDKLDATISPQLKAEFVTLHTSGYKNIILDLSRVRYADSSGLSSILTGDRLCKDAGGVFILSSLNDHVLKLIRISQLDTVLNLIPTTEEAVDAVFMYEIENELRNEE